MLNPTTPVSEGEKGHIVNSFASGLASTMKNQSESISNMNIHSVEFHLMFGV